jgi:hypothetical protein
MIQPDELQEFLRPSGLMMPGSHNCSQVHWCFWPVYSGLKYYVDAVAGAKKPKTDIPIISPDCFIPVGGVHKDVYRTLELAKLFRHATILHKETVAMDEITRGMLHMFKQCGIPVWTTVSTTIV